MVEEGSDGENYQDKPRRPRHAATLSITAVI
jgi:hypothetical protein